MLPGLEMPKTSAEIAFLAATAAGCAIGLFFAIRKVRRDRGIRLWVRGASPDDLAAFLADPSRAPAGLAGPILEAEALEALWKRGDRRILGALASTLGRSCGWIRRLAEDALLELTGQRFRSRGASDPEACRAWFAAHDAEIVFDEKEKSFVRKTPDGAGKA